MEITDATFKPGDWVRIIDHRLRGCSGFVLRYDCIDEGYRMMITTNPKGKPLLQTKIIVDPDQLVAIGIVKNEDDLLSMIDLALDTNDKEWFMELSAQLP